MMHAWNFDYCAAACLGQDTLLKEIFNLNEAFFSRLNTF